MSKQFSLGDKNLLALREAAKEVGYTHDYVARLARDGKISAVQVNRQWFIDVDSLKNFYVEAQLELQARNEYVSEMRRVEREVSESVRSATSRYTTDLNNFGLSSGVRSLIVIVLGCLVGVLVHISSPLIINPNQLASVAQSLGDSNNKNGTPGWSIGEIVVTDTPLSLDKGIVLLPQSATNSEAIVSDLFSDPVSIYEISSTTGVIVLPGASSTELQYVKIPDDATVHRDNVSNLKSEE